MRVTLMLYSEICMGLLWDYRITNGINFGLLWYYLCRIGEWHHDVMKSAREHIFEPEVINMIINDYYYY